MTNSQAPEGFVSVELLNIERAVSDDLRAQNAALRASVAVSREEVARIIDPGIFAEPKINLHRSRYEAAYAKADAILSLPRQTEAETCTHPWATQDDAGRPYCQACGEPWQRVWSGRPTGYEQPGDPSFDGAAAFERYLERNEQPAKAEAEKKECDHIPMKAALDDNIGCIRCGKWLGKGQ